MTDPAARSAGVLRRIGLNAASLLAAYIVPRFFTVASIVVAARVLGAERFGSYGTAGALAVILAVVASLGMHALLVRDLARDPAHASRLIAAANVVKAGSGLAMMAIAALLVAAGVVDPEVAPAALLLCAAYAVLAFQENLSAYFQAVERMHVWTQASALFGLVAGGLGALFVVTTRSVVWFCAATLIGQVAALAWLLARAPAEVRLGVRTSRAEVASLLRGVAPFTVAFVALTLHYKLDVLWIERLAAPADVGLYVAPYKFVDVFYALVYVGIGALYPLLARSAPQGLAREEGRGLRWAGGRTVEFALVAGMAVGGALHVAAPEAVQLLYGDGYSGSAEVLGWLALGLPTLAVNLVGGFVLGATRRMGVVAALYSGALALKSGLDLALIPTRGPAGAALAMATAEGVLAIAMLLALSRYAHAAPRARSLACAAVGVALLPAAEIVAESVGGFAAATAYVLVVVATSWLLGVTRSASGAAGPAHGALAADRWLAAGATALVGVGLVVAGGGAASGSIEIAAAGGGVACLGLLILLIGRWIDGLVLVAISLPMPALVATEGARLATVAVTTALVVGAWVIHRLPLRDPMRLGDLPRRAVILFLAIVLLSAAFAEDREAALREVVNFGTILLLLPIAVDEFSRRPESARRVAWAIAVAAGLAGGVSILQTVGVIPNQYPLTGTPFYRANAGFGQPNETGMYFSLAVPICVLVYQLAKSASARAIGALSVAGAVAGLLCTFSRASWLAIALAPTALAFTGAGRAAARVWLWGALAVVLVDLLSGGAFSTRAISLIGDWVVDQRAALFLAGLLIYAAHPVLGIGPGGFEQGLQQYGPQVTSLFDYVGSAHNGFVDIAAELGTVGLIAFVFLMTGLSWRTLRWAREGERDPSCTRDERIWRRAIAWSIATAFLVTFTIYPFSHGMGQLLVLVGAMGMARPPAGATPAPVAATRAVPRTEELGLVS